MITRIGLVMVLILSGPAVRADDPQPEKIDAKGKPKGYKPGLSPRYVIWYDDAGWHFHTTTNTAGATAFTGRIDVVGGKIAIRLDDLGGGGGPKKGPKAKKGAPPKVPGPGEKLETAGYNFTFRVNKGVENQFVFHPDPDVTALTFDLKINGKADPKQVFIGANGQHPKDGKFTLTVPPKK